MRLRPYGPDDLWIQRRFLKDPASTEHLVVPETDAQIVRRHERYLGMPEPARGAMFVIEAGPTLRPSVTVGYWEQTEPDVTCVL